MKNLFIKFKFYLFFPFFCREKQQNQYNVANSVNESTFSNLLNRVSGIKNESENNISGAPHKTMMKSPSMSSYRMIGSITNRVNNSSTTNLTDALYNNDNSRLESGIYTMRNNKNNNHSSSIMD
jgi:hypothetical protein